MVWRLVVAGGIEERVLKIQEKKRMIVADAFREGSGGRKRSSRRGAQERLAELGVLLGGGN